MLVELAVRCVKEDRYGIISKPAESVWCATHVALEGLVNSMRAHPFTGINM